MSLTPPPLAATIAPLPGDPREALQRLARTRCRFVQFSAAQPGMRPRELDAGARRGLRARLRQLELEVSGIDLWIPTAHFDDTARVDRAVEALREAIILAADLGRVPVSVLLPAEVDDALRPAIEQLLTEAERRGVDLADHAVTRRDVALMNAHRLMVGIDPPGWIASSRDPVGAVLDTGHRLRSARLCDLTSAGMRAPVQAGSARSPHDDAQLDVSAYAIALAAIGYERPVVIDARQWQDPWTGVERSIDAWHAATGDRATAE